MAKLELFYQPLKPWVINQGFGENRVCYKPGTRDVILCDGLNPPMGYISLYGSNGHAGIDAVALGGQEVYCSQRGIVDFIDTNSRSGLDVRIVSEIGGEKYHHIYEHLLGYMHSVGNRIETGQLVGWCDNTGWSSGNHLHFQVEKWIDGQWIPVDPAPLMANKFAKDILAINNKIKFLFEQIAMLADNIANFLRKR